MRRLFTVTAAVALLVTVTGPGFASLAFSSTVLNSRVQSSSRFPGGVPGG
jgi:hypothetical protein